MSDAVPSLLWARELAMVLVEAAKKAGAQACDATVGMSSALSASARDGQVEDVTRTSSRSAAVRVIVDGRLGFATSADAPQDLAAVRTLAESAVALARVSTPSEHNVLPPSTTLSPAELAAREAALATWDDDTASLSPDWAITAALEMERAVLAHQGIVGVRDVSAGAARGLFSLATSSGYAGAQRGTSVSLSCSAMIDDGDGKRQTAGWSEAARRVSGLPPPSAVADVAARRALERRGARKIESVRAPVIFEAPMARGFFATILAAMSGDNIATRRSFFLEKKGQQVLPAGISLVDDPALPGGWASRIVDGEGVLTPRLALIDDDGRITTWLHDARSAARCGEEPTGHAARSSTSLPYASPTNTTVVGGAGDLQSIVRETKRGLLVTRLLGSGPKLTTGEYSRGAAGMWIEEGAVAFPVEEVTIAGNMLDMMMAIDRVGVDLDERGSLRAPTIRFGELAISGR